MYLPLDGIRIVDMTAVVMGPFATQILADLGADVIAIEDRAGDTNRAMGAAIHPDLSVTSLNLMRNKRSVGLDVKSSAGHEVLDRLVATADVFVTNLRPGSRRRAGLTYERLREVRPDLIYLAASGYPADSGRSDDPAYDDVIQAASGVAHLFERFGLAPMLAPTLLADKVAGMTIASAVLTALVHRERTGEGSETILAMSEIVRSFLLVEHGGDAIPEPPVGSPGYSRILTPERKPQRTRDGYVSVLPYSRAHYERLFRAGGREDLIGDPRLESRRSRLQHGDSLYHDVSTVLATKTTDEWVELLREAGVPVTRLGTLDDLVDDLPLAVHPSAGTYRVIPPITGAADGAHVVRRPAPLHGEHGREVLAELGYGDDELDDLEAGGVLFGGLA